MLKSRLFIRILLLGLLTVLIVGVAIAGNHAEKSTGNRDLVFSTTGDCRIGNLEPPVGSSYPGLFEGNESYAYHVQPSAGCSCPENHFRLDSVSMLLDFDDSQIPQTLVVTPSLLIAVFNTGSGCWEPGPALCTGAPFTVNIINSGVQTITAPLTGCAPFPMGVDYFISLDYSGGGNGLLPVDNSPASCTEFIDYGNGWVDLFGMKNSGDKTGSGKLIVFGDIVCVTNAVEADQRSWGSIKTLFR